MDSPAAFHSNSAVLKAKIRIVEPMLLLQQDKVWQHPRLAQLFKEHMVQLYYSVNASVPLMSRALERSQEMADNCPVATALIPYFEEHIEEEKNHDLWVLEDLEVLGVTSEEVFKELPSTAIATLIGSQYFYINHVHPLALIGYLAVIEGKPINGEALDLVVANTSIPKAALRSFYKHAELDIRHSEEMWTFIDGLPLLSWQSDLLGFSAVLVIELLARMAEDLTLRVTAKNVYHQ